RCPPGRCPRAPGAEVRADRGRRDALTPRLASLRVATFPHGIAIALHLASGAAIDRHRGGGRLVGTLARYTLALGLLSAFAVRAPDAAAAPRRGIFEVDEATIDDIQKAIMSKRITVTDLVGLYLDRIKAYNGTCVNEPEGILGPISTIPHAGKLNALTTLNL